MTEEMPPARTVSRALLCELADFIRRLAPLVAVFGGLGAAGWGIAGDTIMAWAQLPDRVAAIEARLPEPVDAPFVEFSGQASIWPERVRAGQSVRIVYMARRNRSCNTTIDRRFQRVMTAFPDPDLSSQGRAPVAALTMGYEIFSAGMQIPDDIGPGIYAYRPVLTCPGERPVMPPPIFFEVVGSDRRHE